mmetsp:Transcript_58128/g.137045  ORF Transcript_58128/g.137045 Transcript_58128/m.137045 type:complete len:199 (-) Transcript_58128:1196-1792(-)
MQHRTKNRLAAATAPSHHPPGTSRHRGQSPRARHGNTMPSRSSSTHPSGSGFHHGWDSSSPRRKSAKATVSDRDANRIHTSVQAERDTHHGAGASSAWSERQLQSLTQSDAWPAMFGQGEQDGRLPQVQAGYSQHRRHLEGAVQATASRHGAAASSYLGDSGLTLPDDRPPPWAPNVPQAPSPRLSWKPQGRNAYNRR